MNTDYNLIENNINNMFGDGDHKFASESDMQNDIAHIGKRAPLDIDQIDEDLDLESNATNEDDTKPKSQANNTYYNLANIKAEEVALLQSGDETDQATGVTPIQKNLPQGKISSSFAVQPAQNGSNLRASIIGSVDVRDS